MPSKRPLRAYLSGGMEHARNEGADWRREIEQFLRTEFGHDVYNPNTESDRLLTRLGIRHTFRRLKSEDIGRYTAIVRDIVKDDSHAVAHECDYVICLWDRSAERGAGTKGEITLARYFGKPVFLVSKRPPQKIPGWVLGCSTLLVRNFPTLKAFLHFYFTPRRGSHVQQRIPKRLPTNRRGRGGRSRPQSSTRHRRHIR